MKCDICIRKEMYAHVALSAWMAMFSGIGQRMTNEFLALLRPR